MDLGRERERIKAEAASLRARADAATTVADRVQIYRDGLALALTQMPIYASGETGEFQPEFTEEEIRGKLTGVLGFMELLSLDDVLSPEDEEIGRRCVRVMYTHFPDEGETIKNLIENFCDERIGNVLLGAFEPDNS